MNDSTAISPFDTIVGQDRARRLLARLSGSDKTPHALLFCGPDGTGRAAAALAYIRALYARTSGERAVGRIETLSHPDFSLLFPLTAKGRQSEQGTLLGLIQDPYGSPRPENAALHAIDRIRELKRRFAYRAFEGRWRSAVILSTEKMREEAASALLKLLEEPPEHSVMILTAPSTDAVLPTIVSRCQIVRFPHLTEGVIADALRAKLEVDPTRADSIARGCGGSFRRALVMAEEATEDLDDRAYRFLEALLWGDPERTFTAIEQLTPDREKTLEVLSAVTLWLRDLLMSHAGASSMGAGGPGSEVRQQRLDALGAVMGVEQIRETLETIERLREMNRRNVNLHAGVITLWRRIRSYAEKVPA